MAKSNIHPKPTLICSDQMMSSQSPNKPIASIGVLQDPVIFQKTKKLSFLQNFHPSYSYYYKTSIQANKQKTK